MATINIYEANHNNKISNKILKALKTNKFNPQITGERFWYNYFIRVSDLVWARNLVDGYQIEVYADKNDKHVATFELNYETFDRSPQLIIHSINEDYLL